MTKLPSPTHTPREWTEQIFLLLDMYAEGKTQREIALKFKVSVQRIQQILCELRRLDAPIPRARAIAGQYKNVVKTYDWQKFNKLLKKNK